MNRHSDGGSNILRGGKRSYDCSTLVGNFVEEAYRPEALKSKGITSSMYITSTQEQMAHGNKPLNFGGGLQREGN
ncbi:hypothetical protein THRCLA_22003, partial [Thraustotheca clavata]